MEGVKVFCDTQAEFFEEVLHAGWNKYLMYILKLPWVPYIMAQEVWSVKLPDIAQRFIYYYTGNKVTLCVP